MSQSLFESYTTMSAEELKLVSGGMLYTPYTKHKADNRDFAQGLVCGMTGFFCK